MRISRSSDRCFLLAALAVGALGAAACGQKNTTGDSSGQGGEEGGIGAGGGPGGVTIVGPDGGGGTGDPTLPFAIVPKDPVINVTIVDGVVTAATLEGGGDANPLQLHVEGDTGGIPVTWSTDRGGGGMIDKITGAFTATGNVAGTVVVTAAAQKRVVTTTVTVHIQQSANGAPPKPDAGDGNLGGNGGVGGAPLGPAVDKDTLGRLRGQGKAVASKDELGWLYPYDKTVWPRGILAPLLQWQTSHGVTAVDIHLKEAGFEFEGTYAGSGLINQPIEGDVWRRATMSNTGDLLHVDLKVDADGVTYGPISQDWIVSPGVLQGTVYYDSYNSTVAGTATGAVLAISPSATSPTVAIPATKGACHVCHSESANGSTIVMRGADYFTSEVYSLEGQKQLITSTGAAKLAWSAVYPDGTMAFLDSHGDGFAANQGDSDLVSTKDASSLHPTGLTDVIKQASTPVFSPDGRHLAFGFLGGPGSATVKPAGEHLLALLDFDCGAPAGGVTCNGQTFAFSGLRALHRDDQRYLGFPSFLPDSSSVVFQNMRKPSEQDGDLRTWKQAQSELWIADVPSADASTATSAIPLYALNGYDASNNSYLPTNPTHPIDSTRKLPLDTALNYQPAVNPIASGGYFWVVFTSRRLYGNVLTIDPWANEVNSKPDVYTKKLWVAAIDLKRTPGKDASHPAFYLPGQELLAGNMRGFWVADPCKMDGISCSSGSECCNGYCNGGDDQGSEPTCGNRRTKTCSDEYERCTTDADCCDTNKGFACINARCASPQVPVH